ncbi:MAG: GNAT family N-acetyltransferase [Propionibacteriaceae bacterium]|jgi:ribosomal-protein-alanine N-acetyltransferase|nr:GNAT family N-acetyltransferase [Propionibacteriaceae bacterium]
MLGGLVDVSLTCASTAQLPELLTIERAAFDTTTQWSAQLWREELAAGGLVLLANAPDGTPAAVAAFRVSGNTAEVFRVATLPARRRAGHATRCLRAGIDWARSFGVHEVLLEVAADNIAASTLYEQLGFATFNRRVGYYQGKDALLMRLELAEEQEQL